MNVYWLQQTEQDLPTENDWLSASEIVCLNALHFPKRRADWLLGRWTAKCALSAYLDVPAHIEIFRKIDVVAAVDGAPEAFVGGKRAGVTISLSHRSGLAICAVATAGVGLGCDLEIVEPRSDAFIADYFTAEEQTRIAQASAEHRDRFLTLLWSGKESALKTLRAGLRLDTRTVIVDPFVPPFEGEGWSPLTVRHTGGFSAEDRDDHRRYPTYQVFHGWWQSAGNMVRTNMVRTVVGAPAPESPIPLKVQAHAFRTASDSVKKCAEKSA
jgi:4'-phosphopantetheinyl transferase